MANSVTARFNDDCKVFVSMSDDTTVEKAVIIDAEGNETDIGSGGGESDFSTAEVTINITTEPLAFITIATKEDGELITGSLAEKKSLPEIESYTLTVILYKGKAYGFLDCTEVTNIDGDATFEDGDLIIEGDCTITLIGLGEN